MNQTTVSLTGTQLFERHFKEVFKGNTEYPAPEFFNIPVENQTPDVYVLLQLRDLEYAYNREKGLMKESFIYKYYLSKWEQEGTLGFNLDDIKIEEVNKGQYRDYYHDNMLVYKGEDSRLVNFTWYTYSMMNYEMGKGQATREQYDYMADFFGGDRVGINIFTYTKFLEKWIKDTNHKSLRGCPYVKFLKGNIPDIAKRIKFNYDGDKLTFTLGEVNWFN